MSLMVNGELRGDWFEEEVEQGAFVRKDYRQQRVLRNHPYVQ